MVWSVQQLKEQELSSQLLPSLVVISLTLYRDYIVYKLMNISYILAIVEKVVFIYFFKGAN